MTASTQTLPPDDPTRGLTVARPETDDAALAHVAIAGDTYTILLSGDDTARRFTLIDMLVPSGGGPLLHRHDFEETFVVLGGEIEVTFRGETSTLRAGETANIPANAPHFFRNTADRAGALKRPRWRREQRPDLAQIVVDDRLAAIEAQWHDQPPDALARQLWVRLQQPVDLVLERVELAHHAR